MSARRALQISVLTAFCAGAAWSADVAAVCATGPIVIQVDQLFQKTDSYTVTRTEFMPRGRPEYRGIGGSHGGTSSSRVTQRLHGEARASAPLSLTAQSVRGTASMTMEADNHIRHRTQSCSLKRMFAVTWTFEGTLSDRCALALTVVRDWTELPPARHTCNVDVFGRFSGTYPPITETWQVSLKAEHGAAVKREVGNFAIKDVSTLTVVRTAPAQ